MSSTWSSWEDGFMEQWSLGGFRKKRGRATEFCVSWFVFVLHTERITLSKPYSEKTVCQSNMYK